MGAINNVRIIALELLLFIIVNYHKILI